MNTKSFITESDCTNTLRQLDLYIDRALDNDATALLLRHLDGCRACMQELESRRTFRARLKNAVLTAPAPSHLSTRVLAHVRAAEHQPRWMMWRTRMTAVAAVFVIAVSVGIAYQLGHLRLTTGAQDAYIASVSQRIAGIMAVGLRDHVHCAVFRKYPKNPPNVETFTAHLGPEYTPLINVMKSALPADYGVYLAHKCRYRGRQFVHLTLKNDSKLVSLVIAKKEPGESFRSSTLVPVAEQAGVSLYGAGVQRFHITGFETRDHLAYLISDMPQDRNTALMAAITPSILAVLRKLES